MRGSKPKKRKLSALILAPTRELALQVSTHIKATITHLEDKPKDDSNSVELKTPPRLSVAAIVGGMSSQKQRRVLDRGVDVLVATPGRLWDILQDVRARTSYHSGSFVNLVF